MGGTRSLRITRVEQTVVAKLMETELWHLPVEDGLSKGTTAFASTFVGEKDAPPTLVPEPENSLPLLMSLITFKLLSQCWSSELVSSGKSMGGPFKRYAWDSL